jgi:hypothetical protein
MWYSRRKNLSREKVQPIGKKRKSFNIHLEIIKDIKQKKPLETNIQISFKANLTNNFNLVTKNKISRLAGPTNFTNSIGSTSSTNSIENIGAIGFTGNIGTTRIWKISPNNYWRVNTPLPWANSSRSLQI